MKRAINYKRNLSSASTHCSRDRISTQLFKIAQDNFFYDISPYYIKKCLLATQKESKVDIHISNSCSPFWLKNISCFLTWGNKYEKRKVLPATQPDLTLFYRMYLLTCEVDLFEVLDVMAQMWHYIIFLAINQQKWLQTLFWVAPPPPKK